MKTKYNISICKYVNNKLGYDMTRTPEIPQTGSHTTSLSTVIRKHMNSITITVHFFRI
jgi:hypothetical protein